MDNTTNQIERHIQETRDDLSSNFRELEEKVKSAVDWRAQFKERPMTLVALAFGGGVLVSALLPADRSSGKRYSGSGTPATATSSHAMQGFSPSNSAASHTLEVWDAFKGALIGLATTKLTGVIEELVPGFENEFTKAKGTTAPDGRSKAASYTPFIRS